MKNPPLFTIVTPSFNQGQFLERTILSVLNQDYPHIEYLIFDGGSTDETLSILQKYAERVTYWESKKDKGQADAINKGWKMAKGQFCCYLNSDDELAPSAIRRVAETFFQYPEASIVYGDYTFVDENNKLIMEGVGRQADFRTLLINGQMPYIAQPSSFYRTKIVQAVGYLDESLHLSMDYDLLLKLSRQADIKYISECLSYFRLHTSAKSSTLMKRHWHETLRVKMKYNKMYMLKSILKYLVFRLFHLMPVSVQNGIRRGRGNINDIVLLKDQ